MSVNLKKNILKVVLLCLWAAPFTALAEVAGVQVPQAQGISEILKSPLPQDLLLFAQSMPYGLVQNNNLYHVMTNRGLLSPAELQNTWSPEEKIKKTARFDLFKDLQFTNHAHLNSICKEVFKTKTQAGKLTLENLLASDNTDWDLVLRRQKFIKALVDSPELLLHIQQSLDVIRDNENGFLAKFPPVNPFMEAQKSQMSKMLYIQAQTLIAAYGFIPEYRNKFSVKGLAAAEAALIAVFLYNKYLAEKISKMDAPSDFVNFSSRLAFGILPFFVAKSSTYGLFYKKNGVAYWLAQNMFVNPQQQPSWQGRSLIMLYGLALSGGLGYKFVADYKTSVKEFSEINGIAKFITASAELRDLITADDVTRRAYRNSFADMSDAWKELEQRAADHKNSTGPSYLCTNNSNITNMLALMKTTGADAARCVQFYGELDAYAAVAQCMLDHKQTVNEAGEPVRVCYSEFIHDSQESILQAQNLWHPLISAQKVRPNSLILGGSTTTPRNAVVTGPNAAGKSVNLKALLVNLVIAQTFGIAFAESLRFTPFTKILGRLNAPDDTAAGHSKFMLEALDVVNMLTQLKSLQPNEHAFVVTDELFSGTEVGPAIELSRKLCSRVGSMKNVIYILATHYKDLTNLKKTTNNAFENYKVTVTKQADGSLVYPFKLTHGIGETNVAFDIFLQQMEKQGLGDEDLKRMISEARVSQEASERSAIKIF